MTLPHEIPAAPGSTAEFWGDVFARFTMKKMADLTQIKPTEWLDSTSHGLIPRGNAMLLVTASSKGKSTSLFHAAAQAAATGHWSMLGSRTHNKPLKVVYISAEDNENSLTRKAVHDGRRDAYAQTQLGITEGRLKIISLSDTRRTGGVTAKVFDQGGEMTMFGTLLFKQIREFKADVVIIDTIRACSDQADLNQESVSGRIIEQLDYLAEDTGAAVIATTHFTKEGGVGNLKITTATKPSTLITSVRGSSQLTDRVRHTLCIFEDMPGLYKELPGMKEGDESFIGALQSNISGARNTGAIFPIVRSKELQVFISHVNGKMLTDVHASQKTWIYQQILHTLPKLIFASSITGYPLSTTGAYSPEKLSETVFKDFLPAGTTPDFVHSAMDSLLKDGIVKMCKVTKKGAPNKLDIHEGPYANVKEGTPPPAKEGSADHELLALAAKQETTWSDIMDAALEKGLVSDEAQVMVRIEDLAEQEAPAEAEPVQEVQEDEGEYMDDGDDGGEFQTDEDPNETQAFLAEMANFSDEDFPIAEGEEWTLDTDPQEQPAPVTEEFEV